MTAIALFCIGDLTGSLASSSIAYKFKVIFVSLCFSGSLDSRNLSEDMLAGSGSGVELVGLICLAFYFYSVDNSSIVGAVGAVAFDSDDFHLIFSNILVVFYIANNLAVLFDRSADLTGCGLSAVSTGGVQVVCASSGDSKAAVLLDCDIAYGHIIAMSFSSKRGNLQETDTHGQDQDQRLQTFGRVLHDTFSSLFLKFSQ